jgi:hypothetical protein
VLLVIINMSKENLMLEIPIIYMLIL